MIRAGRARKQLPICDPVRGGPGGGPSYSYRRKDLSSAQEAARSIKNLEIEDWAVLEALEKSMSRYESVPVRRLQRETGYYKEQVLFRLSRLNYYGFVMRSPFGYIMNTAGLDLLALHSLAEKGLISAMGSPVGMGKESDVFDCVNDSGQNSVIKFYRIGRTSFRSTRKTRTYVNASSQHQWLAINIGAAQKEAEGLTRAREARVNVPEFIARDRHAVVMSKIDGLMLYRCRAGDIKHPRELLRQILQDLRRTYVKGRMVNGDVSEYNVLFDGELTWIIDWPQYVPRTHPNAIELLERDIGKSTTFFRRKFNVSVDLKNAESYVIGKSDLKVV